MNEPTRRSGAEVEVNECVCELMEVLGAWAPIERCPFGVANSWVRVADRLHV